jgi:hypothetical protein
MFRRTGVLQERHPVWTTTRFGEACTETLSTTDEDTQVAEQVKLAAEAYIYAAGTA